MKDSRPAKKAAGIFCGLFSGGVTCSLIGFVLSGLFSVSCLCGQSNIKISGSVYDKTDGYPIAQARIELIDSDYWTLSDRSGNFCFESVPEGRYAILAAAEGYRSEVIEDAEVLPEITTRISVGLDRRIYHLPERVVVGKQGSSLSGDVVIIDADVIRQSDARSLADVLTGVEGVFVMEAGISGAETRVSIRGCDPEQVLVLLDGQRINPSSGAAVDINLIPLDIIEGIEIYRGGQSSLYGSDALGGVINIKSYPSRAVLPGLSSRKYWGKWKSAGYGLTIRDFLLLGGLRGKLVYSYNSAAGDFRYNYRVNSETGVARTYSGIRRNAFLARRNYFWSTSRSFGSSTILDFRGQLYQSRNGLPGSVSRPDTFSCKTDDRILLSGHLRHSFSKGDYSELMLAYSRFTQYFNNLESPLEPDRYETRCVNDIFDFQLTAFRTLWSGNEMGAGVSLERSILYHDDFYRPKMSMGRTIRDNVGLYISGQQSVSLDLVPFFDAVAVNLSLRRDNTDTDKDSTSWQDAAVSSNIDQWSYKAGFSISRQGPVGLVFRGSYGTSYRLPSINALFWKGDVRSRGNPGLRPERAEHSDIGFEVKVDWWADISGGITYFHNYVRDLIEWQPGYGGVWQPVNLAAARITGHEDYMRIDLFKGGLRLDYRNTITVAKNRLPGMNSFNKNLTYRPHYVTQIAAAAEIWIFKGNYSIRLVDIRYNRDANTKWYDAYRVDDMSVGFKTRMHRFRLETNYRVKNLRGENYVLIAHYPMPGREWGVESAIIYSFD